MANINFDDLIPKKQQSAGDINFDDLVPNVPTPEPTTTQKILNAVSESYPGRFARGAGKSFQNEYYGLKGLGTELSQKEKDTIAQNEQFMSENPYSAGAGSLTAQIASFAIPGGVGIKLGEKALLAAPKLAALLAKMPKAAQIAAKIAPQVAADVGLGYAYAPENRGESAALAGVGSLGGRALVGGAKMAGRAIANRLPSNIVGEKILSAARASSPAGSDVEDIAQSLSQTKSPVSGVDYTAAQATQKPYFAALEKKSRTDFPSEWSKYDQTQNTNIYNALMKATEDGTEKNLAALTLARKTATDPMREAALAKAATTDIATPMRKAAETELAGPRGVIPPAKTVLKYVLRETPEAPSLEEVSRKIAPDNWQIYDNMKVKDSNLYNALISMAADKAPKVASTITPDRLYEMRKYISQSLKSPYNTDQTKIGSAVKSAGIVSQNMKNAIDSTLNNATEGAWGKYLSAYGAGSKGVTNANALNKIRSDLLDKAEGGLSSEINNNQVVAPKITRAFLDKIIQKHGFDKYGETLTPGTAKKLADVMTTLQMQEAPLANLRASGTGGGGSDTAMTMGLGPMINNLGAAAGVFSPKIYYGAKVANTISNVGKKTAARDLAKILQSSEETAKFLRIAAAREKAIKAGTSKTRIGGNVGAAIMPTGNNTP